MVSFVVITFASLCIFGIVRADWALWGSLAKGNCDFWKAQWWVICKGGGDKCLLYSSIARGPSNISINYGGREWYLTRCLADLLIMGRTEQLLYEGIAMWFTCARILVSHFYSALCWRIEAKVCIIAQAQLAFSEQHTPWNPRIARKLPISNTQIVLGHPS